MLNLLQRKAENKRLVEGWASRLVEFDRKAGRSQNDFIRPGQESAVKNAVDFLVRKGFDVLQGGGNVFCIKYDMGGNPIVKQIRPFGQRTVKLTFL